MIGRIMGCGELTEIMEDDGMGDRVRCRGICGGRGHVGS